MNLAMELTQLKNQINEAKTNIAKEQGVLEDLEKQLRIKYKLTPAELPKYIEDLLRKLQAHDAAIEKTLHQLKEKYDF